MTCDDGKAIWSVALSCYGADLLEQKVHSHIEAIYKTTPWLDLSHGVSTPALAEMVRTILDEIASGERPLLYGGRAMNRTHLQALMKLRAALDEALLADLPVELLSARMRMLRAQHDFGI